MVTNVKIEKRTTRGTEETFISKIKLKDDFATICFYMTNNEAEKETIFKGKELVTEKFLASFNKLKNTLVDIVPLLYEIPHSDIKLSGISIKYNGQKFKGVVLSAQVKINDGIKSPLNINTPYVRFSDELVGDDEFCLNGRTEFYLNEVVMLAKAYMDGDTKTRQLKLVEGTKDA